MINSNVIGERLDAINSWLKQIFSTIDFQIEPASSDASFRRYFRVSIGDETLILMDAPPAQEDTQPFISIATFMHEHGVHVPKFTAYDIDAGFLLLSDFGNRAYLDELNEQSADSLYKAAIDSLISMQLLPLDKITLPEYSSALLHQEMSLFPEWFLNEHLSIDTPEFLTDTFNLLTKSALEQPQVFVHRDYHSRNLMHTSENSPGIIDFQDAVIGPITYDLVSLLRDCYIEWPDDKLANWVEYYYLNAIKNKLLSNSISLEKFTQWFDWMGLQRHIKVLGIFSRLNYRDGKSNYMNDLPLTLKYVRKISAKYPEFSELTTFLQQQAKIAAI
ncbi:MAG: phosphotransferase [Methylophaga sp.]|nr:phosphotransferase [Methylophaga sp.]